MSFILLNKNQVGGHQEVTKARDKKESDRARESLFQNLWVFFQKVLKISHERDHTNEFYFL